MRENSYKLIYKFIIEPSQLQTLLGWDVVDLNDFGDETWFEATTNQEGNWACNVLLKTKNKNQKVPTTLNDLYDFPDQPTFNIIQDNVPYFSISKCKK